MQEFRGINGRIIIGQNELHILRENSIDSVFHKENEKVLLFDEIKNVVFVPGGVTNGYICCVEKGKKSPGTIIGAMKDENTILFRMFKNKAAENFVQEVLKRWNEG